MAFPNTDSAPKSKEEYSMRTTKTKRFMSALLTLALVLALLPLATVPALAADHSVVIGVASTTDTVALIQTAIQGVIDSAESGDTVTVTGTFAGADATLTLNIGAGVTVVWQAVYSGGIPSLSDGYGYQIKLNGSGWFDIVSGGSIVNTAEGGTALVVSGVKAEINGGIVRNEAESGTAVYLTDPGSSLKIDGGEVTDINTDTTPDSDGAYYCGAIKVGSGAAFTINGGVAASTLGQTIGSQGIVEINGGNVSGIIGIGASEFTIGQDVTLALKELVLMDSGANLYNNGTITADFVSKNHSLAGTFVNNGTFTNLNSFTNVGQIINHGTFNNNGTITNNQVFCNTGVLNGPPPSGGIHVSCGVSGGDGSFSAYVPYLSSNVAHSPLCDQLDYWLPSGLDVTLTATADDFFRINEWIDNTSTVNGTNAAYTITALAVPHTVTVEFERIPLAGTVSITGSAAVGQTLTAVTAGITSTTPGALTYQWKRGATDIGAGSTYVITASDIGQTITVTVSAANYAGSLTSPATGTVANSPGAAITTAAAEASKTHNSITVTAAVAAVNPGGQDIEYLINTDGTDPVLGAPSIWQSGLSFSGLSASTTYYVWARTAAKTGYDAGTPRVSAAITTSVTPNAPGAAVTTAAAEASKTHNTITVTAAVAAVNPGNQDIEYLINTNGTDYTLGNPSVWQPTLTFSGLSASTTYYVWARTAAKTGYDAGTPTASAAITTSASAGGGGSGGGYTPPTQTTTPETKNDAGKTTDLPGGSTIDTPPGQDPIINDDDSISLPGGGTITTPGNSDGKGGLTIVVPPGTVIDSDGRISFPQWSGGGRITYDSGQTFHIHEGAIIFLDEMVPLGYFIALDNPFGDVRANDWYYDAVIFAYSHGLMTGTSANPMTFSPNIATTRGMIVTILYRMAGSPDVSDLANPFGDVPGDKYYADAVKWAAANGIVSGYGDSRYGPEDNITREQLAVILNNYIKYAGLTLPATREYTGFNDEADIANYAKEAIERFFMAGIISGKPGNTYDPQGSATRAEVATMIMRLLEAIAQE